MKRALGIASALCGLLIVVSCGQKTSGGAQGASPLASDAKSGFCILADLPLLDQQADETLKYKESIQLGEKLQLLEQATRAVDPYRKQEMDFIKVRRESGSEGWVRAEFVVANSVLGVVTSEEAIVYSQPKNTAATAKSVPALSIIAIAKETAGQPYLKATLYDQALYLQSGVFFRNEGISTRADDVQSAILLILAQTKKDGKLKKTLLESAQKDYPDSAFKARIEEALAVLSSPSAGKETTAHSEILASTDNDVNVRDKPDENAGTVLAKLTKGQKVEIVEETIDTYTIDNTSAPWYRIKEPAGWVWGGYLAPAGE